VEQQDKHSTDPLWAESISWACDLLDLDSQVCQGSQKNKNDQALSAFFGSLKSNRFYVESDETEAVELVLGKPVADAPQFLTHLNQQGFQRLDGVVEWFANELGVMDDSCLLDALKGRLANLNLQGYSESVQRYAQGVWQAGVAVDRKFRGASLAVAKILQALFHVSTIRPSQRCRVRSQWVERLRSEFSVDELDAAKQIVRKTAAIPAEQFHRPFLFMITREVTALEHCRLPPPVDSRRTVSKVHLQEYRKAAATSSGFDRFAKFSFFLIMVSFGIAAVYANMPAAKPSNVIEFKSIQFEPPRNVDVREDQIGQRSRNLKFLHNSNRSLRDFRSEGDR